MKVAFHTLGCKVNQNDTESLTGLFRSRGYEIAPFEPGADIYVINTCTVTKLGEGKSRQSIRKAVGYHPKAVVVTGCYPQVAPEEVAAISGVDLIIGMAERPQIVELVEAFLQKRERMVRVNQVTELSDWIQLPVGMGGEKTRANLKIQEGCNQYCSYCIVPYARGKVRSMPPKQVVNEFKTLLEAGYKEIVLSGIHLGAYGQEKGIDLNTVISELVQIEGEFRIRLGSIEPTDFTDDLLASILNHPKVCQYLHIPLQSGSDLILRRMNRGYDLEYYSQLLDTLRKYNPLLAVGTDLIVGFPGETDADFEMICNYVAGRKFSRVHIFRYSPRKGTPAADFPERVSKTVQAERSKVIFQIAAESAREYRKRFLGKTVKVLFEEAHGNQWTGLSGEYLRVKVETQADLKNVFMPVRIEEIQENNLAAKII
jgi:threonylcarbamoyladenosine tRNA methylthiotransferase MtaB